jgi:hypothetical protein
MRSPSFDGDGVPHNSVEALKWLIIELNNGGEDKYSRRTTYSSKMSPAQIAEAERLASQWRPTPERFDNRDASNALPEKDQPRWWQFWK